VTFAARIHPSGRQGVGQVAKYEFVPEAVAEERRRGARRTRPWSVWPMSVSPGLRIESGRLPFSASRSCAPASPVSPPAPAARPARSDTGQTGRPGPAGTGLALR